MSTGLENELLEGSTTESDFSSNVLTWDGSEGEARELFDGPFVAEMFNNDFDLFLEYLNDYAAMRDEVLGENAYLMENDAVAQEAAEAGGLLQWAGAQAAAGNDASPEYLDQLQQNWFGAMEELNAKYGLDVANRADSDGNLYTWSGTGWNRYHEAPSKGWSIFSTVLAAVGTGVITGGLASGLSGLVSSALPGLSTTVTSAISKTIASTITQGISNGGDIDFSRALMSGLQEFISFEGVSDLLGDLGIEGETPAWLQDIVDGAEDFLGKVEGAISTGIDPIDAMIQAGGKDVLQQLVLTGEIDAEQALLSMAQTGMVDGVEWLLENYSDQFFGAEKQYYMLDEDGNVVYTFEDAETAMAWADNNNAGGQYNEAGLTLGFSVNEPNELLQTIMEGGGGAALEGAATIIGAAQDMGFIPEVNVAEGSQRYEYLGDGRFRDRGTGEVWTVENTDGLVPGMTVSDDWMEANDARGTDEIDLDKGIDTDYTDVADDVVDVVDDTRDEVVQTPDEVDDTTEVVDEVVDEVVEEPVNEVVDPVEEVEETIEVNPDYVPPQDKVMDLLGEMQGAAATDSTVDSDTTADGNESDGDATEGGEDDGDNGKGESGDGDNGDGDGGTGEGLGGDGIGAGSGGGGLLSGAFEPKVTDLFAYTQLTPYQKQALEPLKQQISTAKGMLS
jgi:hypothetical protein